MNGGIVIPNENISLIADKEEQCFLGIMLRHKSALQDAISFGIIPSEKNLPGHFMHEKNNLLFAIIRNNFLDYGTVLTRSAMHSIVDTMKFGSDEEKASLKGHWDKVWNRPDAPVDDYALLRDHLNDRYLLLQFYGHWRHGDKIISSISGHGDMIKQYINEMGSLKNLDPDSYSVTMGLDEGMEEAVKYIEHKRTNPDDENSIKCNIKAIDDIFNGFARPSYTVISGMINGGKTTAMMNIAFNMARAGHRVAYVSLEKDTKLFFRRTLACHALTDYNRIKIGGTLDRGLNDYWYNKLKTAAKELIDMKRSYHCLQFVQDTKLTKILSEVDKLNNSGQPLDALFVDYLQVIGTESNTIGRPDMDLANIHKRLMAYGRKNNLVTFTALQLKSSSSKDIRKHADKVTSESQMNTITVNTEDYGGSQMIIADADNALGVVLNSDKPPTKMFISFSKARDDASRKTICLDFDGAVGRICDQQYGAGMVEAVDKVLFEEGLNEDELSSDKNLFDTIEEIEKKRAEAKGIPAKTTEPEKSNASVEDIVTELKNSKPSVVAKPVEAKPVEVKPAEVKPVESKPVESKPKPSTRKAGKVSVEVEATPDPDDPLLDI